MIWTAIISAVIFTTMQSQDMKDQEGDKTRGRRTAPLVLGDFAARGTIAIPIGVWSILCPLFWGMGPEGYTMTVPLGGYIIWHLYRHRNFKGDRRSWKLWTLWTAVLVRMCMKTLPGFPTNPASLQYFLPTVKGLMLILYAYLSSLN